MSCSGPAKKSSSVANRPTNAPSSTNLELMCSCTASPARPCPASSPAFAGCSFSNPLP